MAKKQLGITLTPETIERLENICKKLGLTKSNAIAMAINKLAFEEEVGELEEKEESSADRAN